MLVGLQRVLTIAVLLTFMLTLKLLFSFVHLCNVHHGPIKNTNRLNDNYNTYGVCGGACKTFCDFKKKLTEDYPSWLVDFLFSGELIFFVVSSVGLFLTTLSALYFKQT